MTTSSSKSLVPQLVAKQREWGGGAKLSVFNKKNANLLIERQKITSSGPGTFSHKWFSIGNYFQQNIFDQPYYENS